MTNAPPWAVRLRAERQHRLWSLKDLAVQLREAADEHTRARLPTADSLRRMIRSWEAGRHHPGELYARLYARAFGVDAGELFSASRTPIPTAAPASVAPDPELYERITEAVDQPRRVDAVTVEWLERCLAEHRRVEDTVGGRPLLPVVRAQLDIVATLARGASGPLADRTVAMLGEYAQFIAWMCQDSGDAAAALAWYDRSHGWALEAGDASLASTTLNMRAHLAWSLGDAPRCVRLAEASRWHDGRTTVGVQGMAAQMAARGHAEMGDAQPARRLLHEAEELIRAAAEHPEDEPPWMYFYDDGWFDMQRGMAELALGDAARAIAFLDRGLSSLPASYRRDRAWFGSCLARAHAAAGDVDAAESIALTVAPDAVAVNRFARRDLGKVAQTLRAARPRSGQAVEDALRATA
ncbi:helix-turn-helix transcriptional regulator [Sphaerisporangium sp. NPDC051017]|uniref:helix-turn-helix domain-containing protein n=1 Tax=Sphaerisporangium sp. NPDC051017 TaxID=3154636 RepID=UPI00343BEC6F